MSTTRLALFEGPKRGHVLHEVPTPRPRPDQALVRVLGCTICASDLHTVSGRRSGPVPVVLGHEIVGTIEELGADFPQYDLSGRPLQPGDRVTWAVVASCGECGACRRGLPQKCVRGFKYGHSKASEDGLLSGGLAERCMLQPGTSIVHIPDELPLEVACPASCATATAAAAMEAAQPIVGARVIIMGAGLLGLTLCAMAADEGAAEVLCIEPSPERRERALDFGATAAHGAGWLRAWSSALSGEAGLDRAFECSGRTSGGEAALGVLRAGGVLVLVGAVYPALPIALDMEQVVRRQLTIRGVHNYSPRHLASAIRYLATHRRQEEFTSAVKAWYSLDELDTALREASSPGAVRLGIRSG